MSYWHESDAFIDILDDLERQEANEASGFLADSEGYSVGQPQMLRGLTDEQREAVIAPDGPLLVLAGAGSGKTRVLTTRIAYRLAAGDIQPAHVLALTFTRKASAEMKERLERLIGPPARSMDIGTFHGVFARAMRDFDGAFGAPTQSTILDEKDQRTLLKDALKDAGFFQQVLNDFTPQQILEEMAHFRMKQSFPDKISDRPEKMNMGAIMQVYDRAKRNENVLDYDDVLFAFDKVLDNPRAREIASMRWKMILVDEYQDTNAVQEAILKKIAGPHRNITCVGDDDQSIYSFRHADVRNILQFEERWPGAQITRLQQNFRSTAKILAAANTLIAHNLMRHGKILVPTNEDGADIDTPSFHSAPAEADYVVERIGQLVNEGCARKEIAVISRTAAVLQLIEQQLIRKRIPYTITSGRRVADRIESKIIAAYIRAAINPLDETALLYAFESKKRKMGATGLSRLREKARAAHVTLEEMMRSYAQSGGEIGANGKLTPSSIEKAVSVHEFLDGLERVRAQISLLAPPIDIVDIVIDISDINDTLEAERRRGTAKNDREQREGAERKYQQQKANIESLRMAAAEAETIEDMSANIVLSSDRDDLASDAVWLGTIHAAKGLEFETVFLPGFENSVIPSPQSESDQDSFAAGGIEEERNLAYVAITRAKKKLTISYSDSRMVYGRVQEGGPSPFLKEAFSAASTEYAAAAE